MITLTEHDRNDIAAAIAAAERQTSGEIVVVLARAADDYWDFSFAAAIFLTLLVPAFALWLNLAPWRVYEIQLLVFLIAIGVMRLTKLRVALVPRRTRQAYGALLARAQFVAQGLHRTVDRNGVLIFISADERYVEILADGALAERTDRAQWQGAVDQLIGALRTDRAVEGIVHTINTCGQILHTFFPGGVARNDLPNRIIELP